LQQGAFRGRKPRRTSTASPRPTHGTDRQIPIKFWNIRRLQVS
jgi:hypothetical protein